MSRFRDEVELARALIQAPSPSGRESPAAAVLHDALTRAKEILRLQQGDLTG